VIATALAIFHGLSAVALLGAITHQTLATWVPAGSRTGSFFARIRAVRPAVFANAVVVLYLSTFLVGGIVYLYFRVDVRPQLELDNHWPAIGLFDIKEHFMSIGLGLLPAYWVSWRRPAAGEVIGASAVLTAIFAVIIWWGFLIGHIMTNIMGFGS
jgi:hypothetical protein